MLHKSLTDESIHVDATIDVREMDCPFQMLKSKKLFSSLSSGQTLQINGGTHCFEKDILGWCERTGNFFLGKMENKGQLIIFLKKN